MSTASEDAKNLRIRYLRKSNGEKKGVVVAVFEHDKINVGFSLCNNKDRWDFVKGKHEKHFGLYVALDRAEAYETRELQDVKIPSSLVMSLKYFIFNLQIRYRTEKAFPVWANQLVPYLSPGERCFPRYPEPSL